MRILVILLFILSTSQSLRAQEDLFGPSEHKEARHGFILNGNVGYDFPGGDMAQRFSSSWRLGPALLYKTKSNWLLGAKFDFIVGKNVNEDSLMINIRDKYQTYSKNLFQFINNDGQRIGVPVYERGYAVGLSAGKIFNTAKTHPDNGIVVLTSVGFMQHRINIYDKDKSVFSLRGDYLKGYDRLANGIFVEQYLGYMYFSKSRLINFTLGADVLVGFTQGRRDYLYDVMRPDNAKRLDVLIGVRTGWFIPMFKRNSEDMMFE
jgi:hypothetical protein